MIIWYIIGVVVVIFVLFFINLEHQMKRLKIVIGIIILLIVIASLFGWYKTNQVDFSTPAAAINSVYVYFSWVGQAGLKLFDFSKVTVNTVGNVIRSNQTTTNDGRR
jgi:hypothetical protein